MLRSLLVAALLCLPACKGEAPKPEAAASPRPKAAKKPKKSAKEKAAASAEAAASAGPRDFLVPFAWEATHEPLSRARGFLSEMLADNRAYAARDPKFFEAFANAQTPRTTVLTCADSRVQTPAFDATPENDDFMVRNIGNQLDNAEGSVEYGVEHLETPVLLVLGHTGCGAVKAAMGDLSTLSAPVRRELAHLRLSPAKPGRSPDEAWADAVVENVHLQVEYALHHFAERVAAGKLTVVGAVHDFRNDLGNGAGKLTIVDVNGHGEPERIASFVAALDGNKPESGKRSASDGARGKRGDGARSDGEASERAGRDGEAHEAAEHGSNEHAAVEHGSGEHAANEHAAHLEVGSSEFKGAVASARATH